jgi:hypothetical protein
MVARFVLLKTLFFMVAALDVRFDFVRVMNERRVVQ